MAYKNDSKRSSVEHVSININTKIILFCNYKINQKIVCIFAIFIIIHLQYKQLHNTQNVFNPNYDLC